MSWKSIFHTSHLTPLFALCDLIAHLCSFPSKFEELDRISECLPSCPGQNQRIATGTIKNKILMVKLLIKDESSWVPSRVHCSNKKKSIGIISWPSVFILLKYFTDFPKKSTHKVVRRGREIYTIICKHTFLVFLWSKEEFSLGCLALWQQYKTISGTQFQIYLCLEPHLIYFKVYFSKMPKVKTLFTMHTVHCIYFSQQRWGMGRQFIPMKARKYTSLFIYLQPSPTLKE